jgi:hypothetical protein
MCILGAVGLFAMKRVHALLLRESTARCNVAWILLKI